jgi:hypothetical protein
MLWINKMVPGHTLLSRVITVALASPFHFRSAWRSLFPGMRNHVNICTPRDGANVLFSWLS